MVEQNMTLDEFISKYNGKKIEYHSYGEGAQFQCVDLINFYITEVLELKAIIGTNAQDFPSKASKTDYDWIVNTPTGVPVKGDIIIFKSPDGVGHISVFIEGDTNYFKSLDQNYPLNSPCTIVNHNYRNVLGWLHPKKEPMSNTISIAKDTFERLVFKSTQHDTLVEYLISEADPNTTTAEQLKSVVAGLKSRATDQENRAVKAEVELANRIDEIGRLKDEIASLKSLVKQTEDSLNSNVKQYKILIDEYKGQLEAKQGEVDRLAKELGEVQLALAQEGIGKLFDEIFELKLGGKVYKFVVMK
jgi:hypothetical protein